MQNIIVTDSKKEVPKDKVNNLTNDIGTLSKTSEPLN